MKPILFSTPMVQAILDGRKSMTRRVIKPTEKWVKSFDLPKCKYQPGDILWVREKFNDNETADVLYAADREFIDYGCKDIDDRTIFESNVKWRPSIFMPRSAARIWLRVTGVSVKRLQDMDADDARAEGMFDCAETDFAGFWDSINAKRGYPWACNPWVFVISFERCEKPQEEKL